GLGARRDADRCVDRARRSRVQARCADRREGSLMALLTVTDPVKTYPGARQERHKRVLAVDHVTLEVGEGELYTLLGPSGCGKTTTLRSIAGLETPDKGTIKLADRVLFSSETKTRVPANQRGLGMVF